MFSANSRTKLWGVLPAFFVAFILLGCDGGSEPAFVDTPTVSLLGNGTTSKVTPGGLTTLAIALDQPAPRSISVRLLALDDAEAFIVPTSVPVSSGQSFAVFQVEGSSGAPPGTKVNLKISAGSGYTVGSPDEIALEIDDGTSPTMFLVGEDQSVAPGASASLSVQRNTDSADVTVDLFVTPDTTGFSVPRSVVIEEGSFVGVFNVVLTEDAVGFVDIVILPPDGYVLGDPSKVRVTAQE
jgi:hypothetical protein